jgi:hypothetical protein
MSLWNGSCFGSKDWLDFEDFGSLSWCYPSGE